VRSQLPELIPTSYVEGYEEMVRTTLALSWPAKPRFIFTSNNFDTDEIFKVWTASKVEAGIPYFAGQHGNNYGTLLGSEEWPEVTTTDRFFTWGWADARAHVIPAFIFKMAGAQPQVSLSGGLLLIEVHKPHRLNTWDSCFEHSIYQEEQFRFVQALPAAIQERVTVRLHAGYRHFKWSDEKRWKDRTPRTRIDTGIAPIRRLISENRLVVHSYDSTGLLETLVANVPTMCFWHGGLEHLLPAAKPYYAHLVEAGILIDSPERAANLVAARWSNVGEWWQSPKVQAARSTFCARYARIEKNPVRTLTRLLTCDSVDSARSL
jgi:putative transferase (TIGR04331 family)